MEEYPLNPVSIFFSRAMDGIDPETVARDEEYVSRALASVGMRLSNPVAIDDRRRSTISGIAEIVEDDIRLLAESDIVLANLSYPGRSYIGVSMELAIAYKLKKEIYVWVGESGNEMRLWLQYFANGIFLSLDEVLEFLRVSFSQDGSETNKETVISYYSEIAEGYRYAAGSGMLAHVPQEVSQDYLRETVSQEEWVAGLHLDGTIVDLGCGSGRWIPQWHSNATRVLCVDESAEMLNMARLNNPNSTTEFIRGDILDTEWLRSFLSRVGGADIIVLAFVLNLITLRQQATVLETLNDLLSPGTRLLILENQRSVFSPRPFFTRTEFQNRQSPKSGRRYRLLKRNFLRHDLRVALESFGVITKEFYADNFLLAGISNHK